VQLQIVLSIRSLCFFPSLYYCKSGRCAPFLQQWGHSQLALLTACSNFIPIYPNLFWIYLNFVEFLSEKRGHVTKLLGQFWVSSHLPICDAAYILDISYLYYLYRIDQETPNKYPCIWYSSLIITKTDKVTHFFFSYLIDRHIQYMWNHHTSPLLTIDVGISQSSILFLILSTIYIVFLLKFFEKRINNLFIPILVSLFSFVDDGLFVF